MQASYVGAIEIEDAKTGASGTEILKVLDPCNRPIAWRLGHLFLEEKRSRQALLIAGVSSPRRGAPTGAVGEALPEIGLKREIVVGVDDLLDRVATGCHADLASVASCCRRH